MSCLDLCYSVKLKIKDEKNEENDEISPVLLHDLLKEADSELSPLASRIATDSAGSVRRLYYSGIIVSLVDQYFGILTT